MAVPTDSGFATAFDPSAPLPSADIPFRDLVPDPDHPRIAGIQNHTALSWCDSRRKVPAPAWLIDRLEMRNLGPYIGFSVGGKPDPSLFSYAEDEGAPVKEAAEATTRLLNALEDPERKQVIRGDVAEDEELRAWSNPELYVNPGGWHVRSQQPS